MNAYNFGQIEVRKGEYRISGMSHALRHAASDYGLTLIRTKNTLINKKNWKIFAKNQWKNL